MRFVVAKLPAALSPTAVCDLALVVDTQSSIYETTHEGEVVACCPSPGQARAIAHALNHPK